jgi:putative salt-induced outer membrane protein YdiY
MIDMVRVLLVVVAFVIAAMPALAEDDQKVWTGEASASISNQTGTTSSFSGTADAKATRTWEKDEATARLTATYGIAKQKGADEETNQDYQALFGEWKHRFSKRLFSDVSTEVSRDSTQDRRLRFRFDVGPGYRVWVGDDAAKSHFDVSAGIGYRHEIYDGNSGAAGKDTDVDQFADAVIGFEYKKLLFDEKVEWTHTGSAAMPLNSISAYILTTEGIVGIPLTAAWSFRLSAMVEYTNEVPDRTFRTRTNTTVGLGRSSPLRRAAFCV